MLNSAIPDNLTPAGGKRAVLCDRDKTILLIVKRLLAQLGFSVSLASNAKQGLALLHDEQPELLIWELSKQPEIDFHMLQTVQQHQRRPYVILLSTPETLNDDAPIAVLDSGDVFIKPFEPVHLIRRIKWLVKQEKI